MSELQIGLLMGMNGFLIFLLEMPLVKWFENSSYTKARLMLYGALLTAFSFMVLNLTSWVGIVAVGMMLMTVGEMIAFPFSNAFAMERSKGGKQGQYMALYSISFSVAHIFGHNSGMQLIEHLGYDATWYVMTGLSLLSVLFLFWLGQKTREDLALPLKSTK